MKSLALGSFLGVLAFFQVVSTVYAEEPPFTACSSTGCLGVFGSIFVHPSGDIKIAVPDGYDVSKLKCTLEAGKYFTLKGTHPGYGAIFRLILNAQTEKKNLLLRAVEDSQGCEVLYAVLYP